MSDEEKTITMTEAQLERIIKNSIKAAMNELKEEEELPGNEVDELTDAPAAFSLLAVISSWFFGAVIIISFLLILGCIGVLLKGFDLGAVVLLIILLVIGILSGLSWWEVNRTKKMEVLSTIFSAIMALSSLTVAVVSAYFAYLSIGGGAA